MVCSNCGYALGPDDQYCGGCGAFLTDAPMDEASSSSPAGGEDAAYAREPFYGEAGYDEPRRSGTSAGTVVAVIAAVALVGLLLFWFLRDGGDGATATDDTTTPVQTTPAPDQATDDATDPATPTETSTESPTEPPPRIQIDRPASAQACNNVGDVVVYRGNDTTSCPFAENVARAYAELDQPVTSEVTLSGVTSPVTGESYDLTCEYTTPVRCTGGNNAVVYIAAS